MGRLYISLFYVLIVTSSGYSARILAYFPIPSISHQVAFRPVTQELARRGHEVVVITTDPAFPKGQPPENLTEIDLHDISYNIWKDFFKYVKGSPDDNYAIWEGIHTILREVFKKQFQVKEIKEILETKKGYFDLLIFEDAARSALVLSHLFKIPTIAINSLGYSMKGVNHVGAPNHESYYPSCTRQKLFDLTMVDKIKEFYMAYRLQVLHAAVIPDEDEMLRQIFGNDVPSLTELRKNVDLVLLNQYNIWDSNRPVPPNVINIGGIHQVPEKDLPKELNDYLNASKNGVIYFSFGTNVVPSMLPFEKIQIIMNVFSKLRIEVLWKWDKDELPNKPTNVRIAKFFPQGDILRHPKVKLFITQGGLQSTNEAIKAGVPLLGVPMLGDQWYNVEMYRKFGIGRRLDLNEFTEDNLKEAILDIINNDSYRQNIKKLHTVMVDEPMPPLERAVWWIEYVLRNGGQHLRAAAAHATWWEYLEAPLLLSVLGAVVTLIVVLILALTFIRNVIVRNFGERKKVKSS